MVSKEFEEYFWSQGIRLEYTMQKTPKLNGMVERINRTVMERARCMLVHAKFPKTFWAEVLMTTIYEVNMSLTDPLDGDIP